MLNVESIEETIGIARGIVSPYGLFRLYPVEVAEIAEQMLTSSEIRNAYQRALR